MEPTSQPTFQRLLIPLDGSKLAEAVIPAAAALAHRFGARIILLHIREQKPPATVHGEKHLTDSTEAEGYLQDLARRLRAEALEVKTHVHEIREGDVARSIVDHANEFSPDLVVLCAHGRSGVSGMLYGNIAQQVLYWGRWPILLLRAQPGGGAAPFDPKMVLLAMDMKHDQTPALEAASALARAFNAHLRLALVVPTSEALKGQSAAIRTMLPSATRLMLDLAVQDASDTLDAAVARCIAMEADTAGDLLRGDPAAQILADADRIRADLLVMTSHGRAGIDAFFSGSVAASVAGQATAPLLLLKVAAQI